MLDRVTVDTFARAVGETFVLESDVAGRISLELLDASTHEPGVPAEDASGARSAFALTFRGPVDPLLPQRIYRLDNRSTGALEIFIVPVARDDAGTLYEAIFT